MFKNDKVETIYNSQINAIKLKQADQPKNFEKMLEELRPKTLKGYSKMVTNIKHGKQSDFFNDGNGLTCTKSIFSDNERDTTDNRDMKRRLNNTESKFSLTKDKPFDHIDIKLGEATLDQR